MLALNGNRQSLKEIKMNLNFDIMNSPESERVRQIIERSRQANLEIQNRRLEYQIHAAAKEAERPYRLDLLKKKRLFRNK